VRRWRCGVAASVLLAVLVVACSAPVEEPPEDVEPVPPSPLEEPEEEEPGDGPRAGGTLRIGLSGDPASIDPRFVTDAAGERIVDALFDPLVRLDQRDNVVPAAASGWEVLDDGASFRFDLRDARFHDGTPVTADSFKRSFDRIADGSAEPPSFLAYLLGPIEGAEDAQTDGGGLSGVVVEDEQTLRIDLTEPHPGYLLTLAHPSLAPLPEAADGDLETFAERPIGNGPFAMLEPREPGAFLRLSRFEDHHEPPLLDEVVLQIYGDDERDEQWQDLVDGVLQVSEVAPDRLDDAEARFGASTDGYRGPGLLTGVSGTVYLYGFETTQEPFDDPRVRQAISLSIDREKLADEVLQGTRVPADSLVPPAIPASQRGACDHCRHAPDEAAALLADAEVELESLTLTHTRGRTHAAIAESMAEDIEGALGIGVELEAQDLQPYVQAVRRGEVPFFWLGWEASEPDPGGYLYPLFHSSQVGLDNLSRFADEDVDALLEEARAAPSAAAAAPRYREVERRILDAAPMLPLLWHRHAVVVRPEVQDLYWSPLGRVDLSTVWLDAGAQG
jgi:oligopeptide transport system substrate-binding protein